MIIRKTIFYTLLFLIFFTSAHAYFEDFGYGVRPVGMAEAFVAVADDTNAILYNPAGISLIKTFELTGMYASLYHQLNARLYNDQSDYLGNMFAAASFPIQAIDGAIGLGWKQFDSNFFEENTLVLSYATNGWEFWDVLLKSGVNVKAMQWNVKANEYWTSAEKGKQGITLDAGLLVLLPENFRLGLSALNMVPSNMGLTVEEIIPLEIKAGIAYSFQSEQEYLDFVTPTIEMDYREDATEDPWIFKFGVESSHFNRIVRLRAGINKYQYAFGAGISWYLQESPIYFKLDYAFSNPIYIADTLGSHAMGLSIGYDVEYMHKLKKQRAGENEAILLTAKIQEYLSDIKNQAQLVIRDVQMETQKGQDKIEFINRMTQTNKELPTEILKDIQDAQKKFQELKNTFEQTQTVQHTVETSNEPDVLLDALQKVQTIQKQAMVNNEIIAGTYHKVLAFRKTIPEKWTEKIVVGIDEEIFIKFMSDNQFEEYAAKVAMYLQSTLDMDVEIRAYKPVALKEYYDQGMVDLLATYNNVLLQDENVRSVLTIQTDAGKQQSCYLIVKKDSAIKTLEGLENKKILAVDNHVLRNLKTYFGVNTGYFSEVDVLPQTVLGDIEALKLGNYAAIAGYGYVLKLAADNGVQPLKSIAKSSAIPNIPLLLKMSRNKKKNRKMQMLLKLLKNPEGLSEAQKMFEIFCIEKLVDY